MHYLRIIDNVRRYNQTREMLCQDPQLQKADEQEDTWRILSSLQEEENHQDELLNSLHHTFKKQRIWAVAVHLLYYQATILVPLFAYHIFLNIHNGQYDSSSNIGLVAALLITKFIKPFLKVYAETKLQLVGQKMYSVLSKAVLKKSLKVSLSSNNRVSSSQLIKIMQVDLEKIINYPQITSSVLCNIYSIIFNIVLIVFLFGWAGAAGIGVLVITLYMRVLMKKKIDDYEVSQSQARGARVESTVDIFNIIKFIKVAALQLVYLRKLVELREKELGIFARKCTYTIIPMAATAASTRLVVLAVSLVLIVRGEAFSTAVLFTLNYIFLNIYFHNLIIYFTSIKQVKISMNNIDAFLTTEEMETKHIKRSSRVAQGEAVVIENGHFYWDHKVDEKQGLPQNRKQIKDINLTIKRGEFVSIIGKYGSGKSSLIHALLGQMKESGGSAIRINGSIAYAGQKPWIFNATVKENILFGSALDQQRYNDVIHYSCLKADLEVLPEGNETVIGQRGCTLSGGQKARIAFARALYADADILLLDDILSAVDAHVGAFLFFQTLGKYCKGKTVLMVTHALNFVQHTDRILVVDGCRIAANGTFSQLKDLPILREIQMTQKRTNRRQHQSINTQQNELQIIAEQNPRHLSEDDTVALFLERSGGTKFKAITCIFVACISCCTWLIGIELNIWGNAPDYTQHKYVYFYLIITALLCLSTIILFYFIMLSPILMNVYKDMVKGALFAPLTYFDNTPIAKVIHHLSSDLYLLDRIVLIEYFAFMGHLALAVGFITSIVFAYTLTEHFVLLGLFIVFLLVLFYKYSEYFGAVKAYRQAEDELKIPLNSYFSEIVQGQSIIRAFNKISQKELAFQQLQQNYINMRYTVKVITILIPFFISFAATLYLLPQLIYLLKANTYSPYDIFLLINIFSMEEYFIRLNQNIMEFLVKLKCLARCEELTNIPSQDGYKDLLSQWDEDDEKLFEKAASMRGLNPFPRGEIEFRKVSVCYKRQFGDVLRELSFRVAPGEKIGVVGRTGSGKSSLFLTLLRIIQPHKGSITIDGTDCAHLSLASLRANFNFILQEHFLFAGTVRTNTDVTGEHSDQEIVHALKLCGLWEGLRKRQGLQTLVSEGGENLSMGERQLLNITRALLNKKKIVLIDEATASIDAQTDSAIQKVLRTHFADSTVLTIVHRLDSVAHCDKILVLQRGEVREFDAPSKLIQTKDSLYRQLCEQTNRKNKND